MRFTDYSTRTAAYAVIVRDDEVLLSFWNGERFPERAAWSLPGGGIDFGEQIETGLLREIHEETGYQAELTGFLMTHSYTWDDEPDGRPAKAVRLVYLARVVGGELGTVEVGGSTDYAEWIKIDAVPDLKHVLLVRLALEAWRERQSA